MRSLSVFVLAMSFICSTVCATELVQGLSDLIHDFVVQETPKPEWDAYLKNSKEEKARWESSHPGAGSFLDQRLAASIKDAATGDDAKVKALGHCLALYKEFGAEIPEYVQQYAANRWSQIESVRASGPTWTALARVLTGKGASRTIPDPVAVTVSSTSTIAKPYCERCANGGCQTCGYYRH